MLSCDDDDIIQGTGMSFALTIYKSPTPLLTEKL